MREGVISYVGLTGAAYEPAWSRQKNVYFSAVGRSFFEKCFPRNSVHVGFSSHAVLHLSKRSVNTFANITLKQFVFYLLSCRFNLFARHLYQSWSFS